MIAVLSALILAGVLLLSTNFSFIGKKSIHDDAKKYATRHCLAFYPDSKTGFSKAKELCKGVKDDRIYDYTLVPYGDYYLVNYGGDFRYFTDKRFEPLVVKEISDNGKKMIVDYIRYTFKKQMPDKYYNADFIRELKYENIDFSSVSFDIEGESLKCHVPQYEMDVLIPLKYVQKEIGMDFGFPNELYSKPVYLDPDHPVICLTFDDGPKLWEEPGTTSCEKIIDLLYEYDATATFYLIGNNLEERDMWTDYQLYGMLKRSINNGNEYGSHLQSHDYSLDGYSGKESVYNVINGPIAYLKDFMGYEMKTYRPVEGVLTQTANEVSPVPAILWDVDSQDWDSMDPEAIFNQVSKYDYESGDIILFHDIYNTTYEGLKKVLPYLINKGCQLVTVSEMLKYLNIEADQISYYYGPQYYE